MKGQDCPVWRPHWPQGTGLTSPCTLDPEASSRKLESLLFVWPGEGSLLPWPQRSRGHISCKRGTGTLEPHSYLLATRTVT